MFSSATLRLAARNTRRRPVRTLLTVGMVVFGVALLLLALSWIKGASGQMLEAATSVGGHVRIVDPDYAQREQLMPLYENLPTTAALEALLARQSGVVAVEPRIVTGVTVTAGEEIGEVFALAVGASDRYFRDQMNAPAQLLQGRWFSGAALELIAGAKVAQQLGAKVGDELLLLGMTQDGSMSPLKGTLVGIVGGGNAQLMQQILVPLERLRYLTDIPEGATELLVFTRHYRQAQGLAAQLRQLPELASLSVEAWSERDPWRTIVATLEGVERLIAFILVFLTALGIWNTMMMSVLERTHEIGVLRAMGLTRLGAIGLFVGEALAIAVVGGVLGVAVGSVPAYLLEKHGIHIGAQMAANLSAPTGETIHADLSVEVVLTAFAVGLAMAVVGSLVPAWRAASIQPVAAMRSGR